MENAFINQVTDELTDYGKSVGEVGKLRLVAIISRVLGLFLMIFTLVLCVLALFTFGAVAAIDAMSACMPVWAAALIIGCSYIILIVIAIVCRRPLFIHPFIRLLTKQIGSEEELALKTIEAKNKAQLKRVRIECQVENATREVELYFTLLSRGWNFLKGLLRKK